MEQAKRVAGASRARARDVVVVGAGPAGLGAALALGAVEGLDVEVLERGSVGQTFLDWPAGQRFLTPSFTGNGFGSTDLNAVHPATSPAYSLGRDYPDGPGYAGYLHSLADHFELPVREHTAVLAVEAVPDGFRLATEDGSIACRRLVWAGGEFHDPMAAPIVGAEHLDHSATPAAWAPRDGGLVVVGGYESGLDLACHHVLDASPGPRAPEVVVVDGAAPWGERPGSDPSYLLAPRTQIRLRQALLTGRLRLVEADATRVAADGDGFSVTLEDGSTVRSASRPVAAVGFGPGLGPVAHLFERREDGWPLLDDDDQSAAIPGLFLTGPAVRHDALRFCFVYKFRQRFAHVAARIGISLGKDVAALEYWRETGMLIDDLSCCGTECAC